MTGGPEDRGNSEGPIGVFDSGVGGLSVLRAIRAELPAEHLLYIADSGYAPYGDRPREFIQGRAVAILEFLLEHEAKAIVVACNTATGVAVDELRARFAVPIVAMEPAVKPAVTRTRTGVVGVLATTRTLSSPRFLDLVDRHGAGVQVLIQPCPRLVEQVEQGALSHPATRRLVEEYVTPLLAQGADTLVLGCTHFPFLRPLLEELAGAGVSIIDPAVPVARELRRRLEQHQLLRPGDDRGTEQFWTSGPVSSAARVVTQLWNAEATIRELPVTARERAKD